MHLNSLIIEIEQWQVISDEIVHLPNGRTKNYSNIIVVKIDSVPVEETDCV